MEKTGTRARLAGAALVGLVTAALLSAAHDELSLGEGRGEAVSVQPTAGDSVVGTGAIADAKEGEGRRSAETTSPEKAGGDRGDQEAGGLLATPLVDADTEVEAGVQGEVVSSSTDPEAAIIPLDEQSAADHLAAHETSEDGPDAKSADEGLRRESPDEVLAAVTELESVEAAPTVEAPPAMTPLFDIVRVEQDGAAVAAGHARPGEEIEIVVDDTVVSRVTAGGDGAFVAFFDVRQGGGAQRITARAAESGTLPQADGEAVYVASPTAEGALPVIAQTSAEGVRVMQSATQGAGSAALDAISYDDAGHVMFAGRAAAGARVRLYLDNAAVAEADVLDDGSWTSRSDRAVAAGGYTVRLDVIDPSGAVLERIETSFLREPIADAPQSRSRVVQKGDSLWRIAEAHYGAGTRYTLIFGANGAAIRDPDLIYPGQVFTLPEDSPSQ